jgi:siroheme synthase (precorrin-2 oxidase/ferrochelatase)
MPSNSVDEIRAAIAAGAFDTADQLLESLRRDIEAALPQASPAERESMAAEIGELLSWSRKTVLARRSHLQRKLTQLTRGGAYIPAPVPSARQVEIEA